MKRSGNAGKSRRPSPALSTLSGCPVPTRRRSSTCTPCSGRLSSASTAPSPCYLKLGLKSSPWPSRRHCRRAGPDRRSRQPFSCGHRCPATPAPLRLQVCWQRPLCPHFWRPRSRRPYLKRGPSPSATLLALSALRPRDALRATGFVIPAAAALPTKACRWTASVADLPGLAARPARHKAGAGCAPRTKRSSIRNVSPSNYLLYDKRVFLCAA